MFKNAVPTKFFFLFSLILIITSCSSNDNENIEEPKQNDITAPTIACVENVNISIDQFSKESVVDYNTPVGEDNLSGNVIITQTAGIKSGESFPLGTTTNIFEAKDAAGNTSTCSFDVTLTKQEPSEEIPYFMDVNPTPSGKKWTKVENMSDEFNDGAFDDTKWHRDPATDGFGWYGRPPALFESNNVTVSDGNLNVTTVKYETPKNVRGINWTHGGAIVRSKQTGNYGMYYECKMKANKTIMSSTFWLSMKQNCNSGPVRKLELDIQECVGRTHSGTKSWAQKWDAIFHSNTFRHNRTCDTEVNGTQQKSGQISLSEKNHERFFIYGCWWKSPTEILFYIDGEFAYSITPPIDFNIDGYITMAIETYDWNPVDEAGSIFETASFDDLTTKYDWVRTWKLEDQ